MKQLGTVVLLLMGLSLFTACGNFSFQNPIGAPSVVMERPTVTPDPENDQLAVLFKFHTLPGSPGGVVLALDFDDPYPDFAPLVDVPACPVSAKPDECARVQWDVTLSPIPTIGSLVVRAIKVQGYNGAVMNISLPSPAVVY